MNLNFSNHLGLPPDAAALMRMLIGPATRHSMIPPHFFSLFLFLFFFFFPPFDPHSTSAAPQSHGSRYFHQVETQGDYSIALMLSLACIFTPSSTF